MRSEWNRTGKAPLDHMPLVWHLYILWPHVDHLFLTRSLALYPKHVVNSSCPAEFLHWPPPLLFLVSIPRRESHGVLFRHQKPTERLFWPSNAMHTRYFCCSWHGSLPKSLRLVASGRVQKKMGVLFSWLKTWSIVFALEDQIYSWNCVLWSARFSFFRQTTPHATESSHPPPSK